MRESTLTQRGEEEQERRDGDVHGLLLVLCAEGAEREAGALPEGAHDNDPAEGLDCGDRVSDLGFLEMKLDHWNGEG